MFIALADLESDNTRIQYIADPVNLLTFRLVFITLFSCQDTNYHPDVNVLGFEVKDVLARIRNVTQRTNYGQFVCLPRM